MSALRCFRERAERWPELPLSREDREVVNFLERNAKKILELPVFTELAESIDERFAIASDHEAVMVSLHRGDYAHMIELGEKLLARYPRARPVMNNLSDAYFFVGRPRDALEITRRALQIEPENFHALSNLVKFLHLAGRVDEAKAACETLLRVSSPREDIWVKKCEALAYLGEHDSILSLFEQAEKAGAATQKITGAETLLHLAACAAARRGDLKTARSRWRASLQTNPQFDLPAENLEDLDRHTSERNGPWYFSLSHWISPSLLDSLRSDLAQLDKTAAELQAAEAERILSRSPELNSLVPSLLDRGDPLGLELGRTIAQSLKTPTMLEALRNFCLSSRGPDVVRMTTANWLVEHGVSFSSPLRFWANGEWIDTELFQYDIYDEPENARYSDEVNEWAIQGFTAVRELRLEEAVRLFKKCIEHAGEDPSLLNNLAFTYAGLRREREAHALFEQVHRQWPDYFFGKIAMANMAIDNGEYDRAEEYLAPLRQVRRQHRTELAALASMYANLNLKRRRIDAAKSWINLLRSVDPDNPNLEQFERLALSGGDRFLSRLFGR